MKLFGDFIRSFFLYIILYVLVSCCTFYTYEVNICYSINLISYGNKPSSSTRLTIYPLSFLFNAILKKGQVWSSIYSVHTWLIDTYGRVDDPHLTKKRLLSSPRLGLYSIYILVPSYDTFGLVTVAFVTVYALKCSYVQYQACIVYL